MCNVWRDMPHKALLEHATAVAVSVKDKLTLSIGVAVGSSIVCNFKFTLNTAILIAMPILPSK